ncbi:MAG: metallophosphoesterase, partial [Candidatus Caldarchaeum sp.]
MGNDIAMRIAHISDTHITKHGMHLPQALEGCIKLLNRLDPAPDITIHTGDLTDNGILLDYELAVEKMQGIDSEVVYVPGNHDERNYGDSLFKEMVSQVDVMTSVKKAVVLLLDSAIPDSDSGRLGRWRQQLIKNRLQQFTNDVLKITVFHHHLIPVPFSGREKDILEDAGDVLKTIIDVGVNMVLMGHRHVRYAIKVGRTLLVNAGTVSCVRTRGRLGNSFNVIDVYEDGFVKVAEMRIPDGEFFSLGEF